MTSYVAECARLEQIASIARTGTPDAERLWRVYWDGRRALAQAPPSLLGNYLVLRGEGLRDVEVGPTCGWSQRDSIAVIVGCPFAFRPLWSSPTPAIYAVDRSPEGSAAAWKGDTFAPDVEGAYRLSVTHPEVTWSAHGAPTIARLHVRAWTRSALSHRRISTRDDGRNRAIADRFELLAALARLGATPDTYEARFVHPDLR